MQKSHIILSSGAILALVGFYLMSYASPDRRLCFAGFACNTAPNFTLEFELWAGIVLFYIGLGAIVLSSIRLVNRR